MIEERFRWPSPHGNVHEDTRCGGLTPALPSPMNDQSDSLVARARDPEPIGALSDLSADLRNRNERVVELQDEVQ